MENAAKVVANTAKKLVNGVKKISKNIAEDVKNFDLNNTSEKVAMESKYFSAYKGTVVIKMPIDNSAFSFGVLVIGNNIEQTNTIKHEYGHVVQLKNMGTAKYLAEVAVPSVTAFALDKMGKLPYDYFGSPWEADADALGGVSRTKDCTPWPEDSYNSYFDLIKMFFE